MGIAGALMEAVGSGSAVQKEPGEDQRLEEAGRGSGSAKYFASLIDSAVRNLRDQAHDMLDKASDIEKAWKKWDVNELVSLGVLNRSQATQLKAALEGSVTRFFAGSRRHESDSSDVDLNALFTEAADELTERRAKKPVIDQMRQIVKEKTARKIQGKMVDLWTASHVVQVYDALNPENQKKLESLPLLKMVDMVWKLVKKVS
jgi:hypothetical protein